MPARPRARRSGATAPAAAVRPVRVLAGRAFLHGRLQPIEIGLDDEGRIVRVARSVPGGDRTDLGERILLPAATDLHVHLREPAPEPAVESFASGTEAAALGGIATVGEMPNGEPPTTTVERLEEKAARARGRLAVDVVLFAALLPDVDVGALGRRAGAFKLYLSPTTGVAKAPGPEEVRRLLAQVEPTGLAVSVHAEDPRRFPARPPARSLDEWSGARPIDAEASAVAMVADAPPGLRLHLAHVTAPSVADAAATRGMSFEATPHHLLLAADGSGDTHRKVNPPLRSEADRAALWERFRTGTVPIVASDHAPHAIGAKDRPFPDAPSGVPGVETMLPLLLARVRRGDLPLPVLLAAACDRPARWLGLPQGRIAVGHRANLLAVDFRDVRPIRAERLATACRWTPFEGWEAIRPSHHFRDGETIVEDGVFVGSRVGRVVRPEYAR
ncbi:MAG TPA: amidohydrolase family protein [Thermoplasmata archaeon]|nr:amidohydrolase family protein [Thermoplasmata archaeon]